MFYALKNFLDLNCNFSALPRKFFLFVLLFFFTWKVDLVHLKHEMSFQLFLFLELHTWGLQTDIAASLPDHWPDWEQTEVYLLANGFRSQLIVVQHEPHQIGCIRQSRVGHSCNGIILEVQVFDMRGNGWHGCQAPPITVHRNREGMRAVTLLRTCPSFDVCPQGVKVGSLAPSKQPGEGVRRLGVSEWKQGRQEDNHQTHGHSRIYSAVWQREHRETGSLEF